MKKLMFLLVVLFALAANTNAQVTYLPEDGWWSCVASVQASNWSELGTAVSSNYSGSNVQVYINSNFMAECSYDTFAPGSNQMAVQVNTSSLKKNEVVSQAALLPPQNSWASANIYGSWTTNDNGSGSISLSYYNTAEGMVSNSCNTSGSASQYITLSYSVSAEACTVSYDSAPNFAWAHAMLDFIW